MLFLTINNNDCNNSLFAFACNVKPRCELSQFNKRWFAIPLNFSSCYVILSDSPAESVCFWSRIKHHIKTTDTSSNGFVAWFCKKHGFPLDIRSLGHPLSHNASFHHMPSKVFIGIGRGTESLTTYPNILSKKHHLKTVFLQAQLINRLFLGIWLMGSHRWFR